MRKITTLLGLMLLYCMGAVAQESTINVGYANGTYYRIKNGYELTQNNPGSPYSGTPVNNPSPNGANKGSWAYKWVADHESKLTIEITTLSDDYPINTFYCVTSTSDQEYFDTGGPRSWKVSVAEGYVITEFFLRAKTQKINNDGSSKGDINLNGNTHRFLSDDYSNFQVTDLNTTELTFTTSGGDNGDSNAHIFFDNYYIKVASKEDVSLTYNYNLAF